MRSRTANRIVRSNTQWRNTLSAMRAFLKLNDGAANPHSQVVMPSPPTVVATGAGNAGNPGGSYTALTQAAVFQTGTDAAVRYEGGGSSNLLSPAYRQFPTSTSSPAGGNVSGTQTDAVVWRATVLTNASAVGFGMLGGGASIGYRFIVNGQYVSLSPTLVSTGGRQYIVLDFGSSALRTISCESVSSRGFAGVYVAVGDTLTVPPPLGRIIMLGDSFTAQTGATVQGDGLSQVVGDYVGMDMWSSGQGGTGYIATSSGTRPALGTRTAPDILRMPAPPTVVIVSMGLNDVGLSGVQNAASACFDLIRQLCPAALVFVVGPWDVNAPSAPVANYASCKSAIQGAMGSRPGFWLLDPQGVSYTKIGDNTHPDTPGHLVLGQWMQQAIRTAVYAG